MDCSFDVRVLHFSLPRKTALIKMFCFQLSNDQPVCVSISFFLSFYLCFVISIASELNGACYADRPKLIRVAEKCNNQTEGKQCSCYSRQNSETHE